MLSTCPRRNPAASRAADGGVEVGPAEEDIYVLRVPDGRLFDARDPGRDRIAARDGIIDPGCFEGRRRPDEPLAHSYHRADHPLQGDRFEESIHREIIRRDPDRRALDRRDFGPASLDPTFGRPRGNAVVALREGKLSDISPPTSRDHTRSPLAEMTASARGPDGSVGVGADDLAHRPRRQGPIGDRVDGVLEEVDRPVGEEEVDAAGVAAPVVLDVRLGVVGRARCRLPGRPDRGPASSTPRASGLNWSVPPSTSEVLPSQPPIERAVQVT